MAQAQALQVEQDGISTPAATEVAEQLAFRGMAPAPGKQGALAPRRPLVAPRGEVTGNRVSVSTTGDQAGMTSRYVGVVVVWVAVLLALYAVQQYFS